VSTEELDGVARRRLVVVAIDVYDDQPEGFEEAIAEQVSRITDWLANPSLGADRCFEVRRATSVRTVDELRAFLRSENLAAASYRESIVVYITGHGLRRGAARHFLTLPETEPDRPFATAFSTSELITEVLDSESEHVMVLVDSCFSGTLLAELPSLFESLCSDRRNHKGLAVVTAGDHEEQPLVGSFTQRIALAYERMLDEAAGYTASHLSFQEWEQLLDEVGRDENGQERDLIDAHWILPRSRKRLLSACLPNPRYQPKQDAVGPALRQLALVSAAEMGRDPGAESTQGSLEEFWLERASGRVAADDPGWYFSGRAELMTRMTGFLRGPAGVLIVTGAAGSGKSALLARLVTLSDPGFIANPRYEAMVANVSPELRPVPKSVDVAVLARNKSARVVVEELLVALGGEEAPRLGLPLQTLIRLLNDRAEERSGLVTVVIDALDEAEDSLALFNDVILPLARFRRSDHRGAIRLLLGIRSSPVVRYAADEDLVDERADQLLQRLTSSLLTEGITAQEIRSDGPDCIGDITAYATTLLLAPQSSPYHGMPEAAAEAAHAIAAAVAPSFLDARIAADQLRRAETRQDPSEEDWLGRLADGTTGLLREDIKTVSLSTDVSADLLVAALRATAFAPGAGLPWAEVWPAITTALVTHEYGHGYVSPEAADHAIRTLRSSRLTGYLAIAEEDARTVYRPVHQRLTDLLVADHDWLLAPPSATNSYWRRPTAGPRALVAAHGAITGALAGLVSRSRPHLAHPYIRRHFLHHAAAGEVLTDQAVPLELLAQETSGALRAHLGLPLPTADPQRRTLTAAAIIEPHLDDSVDWTSRVSSIIFHRGRQREVQGSRRLPIAPVWSRWAAPTNVLAPPFRLTAALCAVPTLDGRTLIAAGAAEGEGLRIWDATTGECTADLAEGISLGGLQPIRATGGRTFLVSLDFSDVKIIDPTSGQIITALSVGAAEEVHVLEDGFALWKVLITTGRGAALWRPSPRGSGSESVVEVSEFPVAKKYGSRRTAVVRRASGHALVAVATAEGIRLWDPVAGLIAQPPFGGTEAIRLATVARSEEDDLLLVGNGSLARNVEVWNPFTGVRVVQVLQGSHNAVALPGGRAFARSVGSRIVVRDIDTGMERSFDADVPTVDALAVAPGDVARRLVSAGPQGIRIWDLDAEPDTRGLEKSRYRPLWTSLRPPGRWSLCKARYSGDHMGTAVEALVLGRPEGLDIHDAATGEPIKRIDTGNVIAVQSLPAAGLALVAVTGRTSWSLWNLASEVPVATMHGWPLDKRPSCTALTPAGRPILIIGEGHSKFRCLEWDPDTGEVVNSTVAADTATDVGLAHSLVALPPRSRGDTVVVAAASRECISLVDMASGERAGTLPLPHARLDPQHLCTFTAQGRLLLAASTSAAFRDLGTDGGNTAIHVWDTASGTLLATWGAPDTLALTGLDLPDGRTLLASGDAGGIRIWDPWTGGLHHTLLTGAPVHALSASTGKEGAVLHIHGPAGLAAVSVEWAWLSPETADH
jgi:WD40 repeat protein